MPQLGNTKVACILYLLGKASSLVKQMPTRGRVAPKLACVCDKIAQVIFYILLSRIFEGTISPLRIIEQLSVFHGKKILPQQTLIIFDEVQEMPRALTSLKYFAEEAPQYAICCAGSLLGVALHQGTSFPVGKVDFLDLYPLSFREFLMAYGEEMLVDYLLNNGDASVFEEKLIDYLKSILVMFKK